MSADKQPSTVDTIVFRCAPSLRNRLRSLIAGPVCRRAGHRPRLAEQTRMMATGPKVAVGTMSAAGKTWTVMGAPTEPVTSRVVLCGRCHAQVGD